MKINLLSIVLATISALFYSGSFSQNIIEGAEAEKYFSGASLVRTSPYSDLPSYIKFKPEAQPEADQVMTWLRKNFGLDNNISFELKNSNIDGLGFQHFRFQQTFNGFAIEDAIWIVHVKNDRVSSMNGMIYQNLPSTGSYSMSESAALQKALDFVGADSYKWQIESEENHLKTETEDPSATYFPNAGKVYISNNTTYLNSSFRAAYKFNIYAHSKLYRAYVYVDAITGEIISEEELLHDIDTPGTAQTAYSGTQPIITDSFSGTFRLRESGRGNGIRTYDMNEGTSYGASVDFTDADNNWNNVNAQLDQYATDAHWGAEMTYDYYFYQHGRNSIDDNGFILNSYVHYDVNFANAFWDGSRMTYGDGDGSWDPLTALDIAGHEITHGLTTFTADLNYSAESGALNESFSDIFGTSIENYGRPTNWNWLIGEDIGSALRSMSNPNGYGDPDTYFGTNWASLTGGDNGGVHTNSGVQNFWYYLMVQGGSGTNDQGEAYTVTGLGFTDASEIAFRNLTVYLTPTSNYDDARFFAIQSAIDLFGGCTPQVATTTNAWYAVGVGNSYVATVVADFSTPVVTSCSAPFTVTFTNNSSNGTSFDWDFGDGGTSTANNPTHTYLNPGTYTVSLDVDGGSCGTDDLTLIDYISIDNLLPCTINMPASGTGNLQTACSGTLFDSGGPSANYGADEDAQITISPTGASSVSLTIVSFDVESGTSGTLCDYDYVRVYDGPNTTSPLIGTYCNNNLPPTTINSTGGSITVRFHSDGGLEEPGFEIDWNCVLPTVPPVTNFTANMTTTCSGEISFTDLSTNAPDTWSWDFGDGNVSTLQNPSHNYSTSGTYTVQLIASNSFGSDPEVKTNYIVVSKPAAPASTGDLICENNTADLSATGTGTLSWFDAPVGGTLLNTGPNFTTTPLISTTSYYVEEETPGNIAFVGPATNTFGTGGNFNGDQYQIFDCTTPVILKSVVVYASGAGNRTIQLRDNVGNVIQQAIVNIPNGTSTVNLNFDIPVGTNLQLGTLDGSSPSLYRNNAGASYPYTLPGQITITGSSAGGAYYYFFYNWEIEEYACISERAIVTATVNPNQDATITPQSGLCTNDSPVVLNAIDGGGVWSGTGVVGSTFDPTLAGIGNHTITYTISGMCGSSDTETISVSDGFNATINPVSTICSADAPINLTGTDAGGVWSGTGIINSSTGEFDPTVSGIGTHTITYTFSGTCGDVDTETITVAQQADATISGDNEFCSDSPIVNLTATDAGGLWSGSGITDAINGTFDPAVSGNGIFTISYTISGTCSDTDSQDITVIQKADATINPVSDFCSEDAAVNLTAADSGGIWTGAGIINSANGTFNPLSSGAGNHVITYTIAGTCGDSDTETIMVNQQSDASITAVDALCRESDNITLTAAESGGIWSADCGACINNTTGEFNPALAGIGSWTITYTVGTICPDTANTSVLVVDCLGLNEENANEISIYPNPTSDFVTISTGKLSAGYFVVTDVLGRELIRIYFNSHITPVDLSIVCSRGSYFIQIYSDTDQLIATKKIIKN